MDVRATGYYHDIERQALRIAKTDARALEESNKYVAYCDLAEKRIKELEEELHDVTQVAMKVEPMIYELAKLQLEKERMREVLSEAIDATEYHPEHPSYKKWSKLLADSEG
jgi:regulator of replication initiation timing